MAATAGRRGAIKEYNFRDDRGGRGKLATASAEGAKGDKQGGRLADETTKSGSS
jgi:hypothetical protein